MTLRIMTLSIMTLSILTHSITGKNLMLGITTLSILALHTK
jgi:hypothetical protein